MSLLAAMFSGRSNSFYLFLYKFAFFIFCRKSSSDHFDQIIFNSDHVSEKIFKVCPTLISHVHWRLCFGRLKFLKLFLKNIPVRFG